MLLHIYYRSGKFDAWIVANVPITATTISDFMLKKCNKNKTEIVLGFLRSLQWLQNLLQVIP